MADTEVTKKKDLTSEQIEELFKRKKYDMEARDILVAEYMNLAKIIALKYMNRGKEYDDLLSVAHYGLLKAVIRYDLTNGASFETYATSTISGHIKNFFRDDRRISASRRVKELCSKITKVESDYYKIHQQMPTIMQLAEAVESSEEKVIEAKKYLACLYNSISLDGNYDDDEKTRGSAFADCYGLEDEIDKLLDEITAEEILKGLGEEDREFIIMRFWERKPQRAISEELGVSQMYVSRHERKIIGAAREKVLK